ncbi:MAG TPA: ATP-binding protein, partial [Smithellaceae bacterium]|nr:ATP-binding protein [Smithellaceae bacterium]
MKRSLFFKIFGTYLAIVALSFIILNLFARDEIKNIMTGQIENQLMTYAQLLDLSSAENISQQLKQIAGISGARVTLVDALGKVFADSEKAITVLENHLNRPEIQEARLKGKGNAIRYSATIGVDMLYVAVPIKSGSRITGYVRLARPLFDVRNTIEKVYNSFFLALFLVAVCSLIIAIIFAYRLALPIKAMERFTEKLRQGQAAGAVFIKTSDETKKLADNINYLVAELETKIRLANEESSKLMTAFGSMNEGVIILDETDRIEVVNPAMSNILTAQYGEVIGKTLLEAFRSVELQKAFLKFKETCQPVYGEITLGNLQHVILKISISGIQGNEENKKTMVVFHDITRLKRLERIKIDFVANVTHEIRTPLTAILGYLETIRDGALANTEETRKFIDIILQHAERLNRLVEDLLTISKIELGETNFHWEECCLADAVNNILPLVATKAKMKNIEIVNLVAEILPPIRADKDRLSQIFVNILDNAVKFTPENGKVTVGAEIAGNFVAVTVSDTGIGIPPEEIERLGERFYRVDKNRSRELGGTGLGLSIVKHLMIAHAGKMEITSHL